MRILERGGRLLGVVALTLSTGCLLSGCTNLMSACPAVGWSNTLEVEFAGSAASISAIDELEVCGEGQCWVMNPPLETPDPSSTEFWTGPATELSPTKWALMLDMDEPASVTVTATGADGIELGSSTSEVTWAQTSGDSRCGGPHTAGPVTLTLLG